MLSFPLLNEQFYFIASHREPYRSQRKRADVHLKVVIPFPVAFSIDVSNNLLYAIRTLVLTFNTGESVLISGVRDLAFNQYLGSFNNNKTTVQYFGSPNLKKEINRGM